MRTATGIGIIAASAALAACGTARSEGGPTVEQGYQVPQFNRIHVAGPYEVEVRTGGEPSVRATGSKNAVERLDVDVEGGTLRIRPQERDGWGLNWSQDSGPVKLQVTVPALAAAGIAGSGDIRIDRIAGESFEGDVAGSGNLRLGNIEVQTLKVGIAGSGEVRAQGGRARDTAYDIAGAGDIDMGELTAETAAVSIAGSGKINASATGTAKVDIAGSGDVRLRGGADCQVSKIGSGNVDCS